MATTTKIRCRLNYHYFSAATFKVFSAGVRVGIFSNPLIFMSPTVMQMVLDALILDCNTKYNNYKNHIGTKAEYLAARKALNDALDKLALYVTEVADNNSDTIMIAGYTPTKGNNSNVNPPTQPLGVKLNRDAVIGILNAECKVVEGADTYGGLLVANQPLNNTNIISPSGQIIYTGNSPIPAAQQFIIDLTKGRKKVFSGLQVGVTYYAYFWAINAGGVSALSNAASRKVIEG